MLKTRKNQKGFTLTELIIVIVIIGILAAVLIPTLSSYVERAKKSAAEQNAVTMYQEWAGSHEDAEVLAELLVAKYYVEANGYYVLIENGSVQGSQKGAGTYKTDFDAKDTNYDALSNVSLNAELKDLEAFQALDKAQRYICLSKTGNAYIAQVNKTIPNA